MSKDKKVEIRFVNDNKKIVAPATQVISVTLGERAKPTKLTFTKDGDRLVSDKAVPAGNDYPTVVEIKTDAKAKAVNEKIDLNMDKCPTCSNLEHACTCGHGSDEKGGTQVNSADALPKIDSAGTVPPHPYGHGCGGFFSTHIPRHARHPHSHSKRQRQHLALCSRRHPSRSAAWAGARTL